MIGYIKSLGKEFKEFALKGNVIDLAVGLVIGAAFTKIVTSLVDNIMMPPLGILMGGVDFSNKWIILRPAKINQDTKLVEVPASVLKYGVFINNVIDFIIVAFAVFIVIKLMNSAKRQSPPADPTTKDCPLCLSTIPLKAVKCAHCTADLPA